MSLKDVSINYRNKLREAAQKASASSSCKIGNIMKAGTRKSSSTKKISFADLSNQPKRTQQEVETDLNNLISDINNISSESLKKILSSLGHDDKHLLCMDVNQYKKLLVCISEALKYINDAENDATLTPDVNNKEKMNRFREKLAGFEFFILYSGDSKDVAKQKVDDIDGKDLFALLDERIKKDPNLPKELKDKDISELKAEEIKEIFKNYLMQILSSGERKNPKAFLNFFVVAINKCEPEEKAKIFEAFALLLKDQDLKHIKEAFFETAKSFVDAGKLQEFITGDGARILETLGFSPESIKMLQGMAYANIDVEKFEAIFDNIIKALAEFNPDEIGVFFKVATQIKEDPQILDHLSEEEKAIYDKYSKKLDGIVPVLVGASLRDDLSEDGQDKLRQINETAGKLGLNEYIYNQINNIINNPENQDYLGNISKEELIKKLNEYTNNKYSETIGDTNPEHLYNGAKSAEKPDEGIGLSQRVSSDAYSQSAENLPVLRAQFTEEKPEKFVVETNSQVQRPEENKTSVVKTQAIKSVEAFNYALSKGLMKIDDAGKEFDKACKSVQLKVISYLQTQKNNRLNKINEWHNSELATEAAVRFNFNKEQIEELKLSIGRKQVMLSNYEQMHKTEKEEA